MAIGMTKHEFMHSLPNDLHVFFKSYKLRRKIRDEEMWCMGKYVGIAVSVAMDHAFNGRKSNSKYPDKPFMQEGKNKKEVEKKISKEQLEKNAENVFLQLGIMGANFNRQKKQESMV